jgi:hypothetical protein
MKYGKFISVRIIQHGQAYLGDVRFMDELDNDAHFSRGTYHRFVTPASMSRLATAINNSDMRLELDEYGTPTWTREIEKEAANE